MEKPPEGNFCRCRCQAPTTPPQHLPACYYRHPARQPLRLLRAQLQPASPRSQTAHFSCWIVPSGTQTCRYASHLSNNPPLTLQDCPHSLLRDTSCVLTPGPRGPGPDRLRPLHATELAPARPFSALTWPEPSAPGGTVDPALLLQTLPVPGHPPQPPLQVVLISLTS